MVSAAADERELSRLLWTGLQHPGPFAVRYPRSNGEGVDWSEEEPPIPIGKGVIMEEGSDVVILGYGFMVYRALEAAEFLKEKGINPTVVNMRFAKPLDTGLIRELSANHHHFVTYEDHTISGGFGSAVSEALHDLGLEGIPLLRLGIPDTIIEQGSRNQIFEEFNLLPEQVARRIESFIHTKSHAVAAI